MKEIEVAASSRVRWANIEGRTRGRCRVCSPGLAVIGFDMKSGGEMVIPAVHELLKRRRVGETLRWGEIMIVRHIELSGKTPLFEIVETDRSLGIAFRTVESWKQQTGKDRNYGDSDQQLQ